MLISPGSAPSAANSVSSKAAVRSEPAIRTNVRNAGVRYSPRRAACRPSARRTSHGEPGIPLSVRTGSEYRIFFRKSGIQVTVSPDVHFNDPDQLGRRGALDPHAEAKKFGAGLFW